MNLFLLLSLSLSFLFGPKGDNTLHDSLTREQTDTAFYSLGLSAQIQISVNILILCLWMSSVNLLLTIFCVTLDTETEPITCIVASENENGK